jgi:hypothetical protein
VLTRHSCRLLAGLQGIWQLALVNRIPELLNKYSS